MPERSTPPGGTVETFCRCRGPVEQGSEQAEVHPVCREIPFVLQVFAPRPDLQMIRVDAAPVIAAMPDHVVVASRHIRFRHPISLSTKPAAGHFGRPRAPGRCFPGCGLQCSWCRASHFSSPAASSMASTGSVSFPALSFTMALGTTLRNGRSDGTCFGLSCRLPSFGFLNFTCL